MSFLDKARQALEKSFNVLGDKKDLNPEQLEGVDSVSDQTKDEQDIVSYVRSKVEEARGNPARIAFESQYLTNSAYLMGYDSLYFDSRSRQFVSFNGAGRGPSRNRVHANLILPNIQNRLARLCQNQPRYDVRPNSNSQEHKEGARLTLKVINQVWEKERINEKRIDGMMYMQQGGHSWGKVYWDEFKGERLLADDKPEGQADSEDQPLEFEGDVAFTVHSALEIFCDPLAKSYDEMQWLIHAKVRKIQYFREHYPERGQLVEQEGAWLLSIQNELRINNMTARGQSDGTFGVMKDAAIELALYEAPSRKYPNGRMIVTANGVLLSYKELPCGMIPYVKFDDVKIGGKFYPESVITHMRPIQDQFNKNLRRKAEYINKGLTLKVMAAKGHGLISEGMNNQTEVYEYNAVPGADAPRAIDGPHMPEYVFKEDESLNALLNDICGLNEASKGQLPAAGIPAVGLQLLQEADATRISVVTESLENSWALVGKLIAKYTSYYYKTERYLKEAGQDGTFAVQKFTGEDMYDSFDVIVVRGSTLPLSKVLKRQEIINLYSQGLMGNPQDPVLKEKVLNSLEFGDLSESWEDLNTDMAQIRRSMLTIESGQLPTVYEADNHGLHMAYKNRIRKSEKFELYDPDVQKMLLLNIETHLQYLTNLSTNKPTVMASKLPPNTVASMQAQQQNQAAIEQAQQNVASIAQGLPQENVQAMNPVTNPNQIPPGAQPPQGMPPQGVPQ